MNGELGRVPCLLVPGLDGSGALFGPFVDALGTDFECSIVRFGDELERFDQHVATVLAALDDLERPALLVAESFGGPVATAAAAKRPERVRALLLVATFVTRPTATVGLIRPWFRLAAGLPWPHRLRRAALSHFLAERGLEPALLSEVVRVNGSDRVAVLARRLGLSAAVDVRAALAALRCPVAYLAGTGDKIVPVRWHAGQLQQVLPGIQVQMLEGAPHMVLQCRPAAAAELARALLTAGA